MNILSLLKLFFLIFNFIFLQNINSQFCESMPIKPIPIIDQTKKDKYDNLILKYAPVFYLHAAETALPISAEEYFTSKHSGVNDKSKNVVVIPKGNVTMKALYDLKDKTKEFPKMYIDVDDCVTKGSNPDNNKDSNGNLNTPVYAFAFEQNGNIYLQYIMLYGLNAPYVIGEPFSGELGPKIVNDIKKLFPDLEKKIDEQVFDFHYADLEHFTIEIDKNTNKIKRLYFSAHSTTEGLWLDADDSEVEYENGHPIVYIAKGSHGTYSKEGIYVRIYAAANDQTKKDRRWNPRLIRIYKTNDPNFDPNTMGWVGFPGTYGIEGVGNANSQGWVGNVNKDIGKSKQEVDETFWPYNRGFDLDGLFSVALKAKIPT